MRPKISGESPTATAPNVLPKDLEFPVVLDGKAVKPIVAAVPGFRATKLLATPAVFDNKLLPVFHASRVAPIIPLPFPNVVASCIANILGLVVP